MPPLPVVPITPVNHLKSIDDKLNTNLADLQYLLAAIAGLVPFVYTRVAPTYNADGTLATALYYDGLDLVATVTCTYTNGNLTNVVRT